jgi:hypothetical protein
MFLTRPALFCDITQRKVKIPYRRVKGKEFWTLEDRIDRLSRNVGTELLLYAM